MCRVVAVIVLVLVSSSIGPNSVAAQGPPEGVRVEIVNPLPVPVTDAGNPVPSPFQASLCGKHGSFTCQDIPETLTVPGDVRLVIEFVSFTCSASGTTPSPATVTIVGLTTTVSNSTVRHNFIPVRSIGNSSDSLGSQSTKLYADPGTEVRLAFASLSDNVGSSCFVSISGHTIAS